ncbi:hypothetical protein Pyn_19444 [Prunus yedoensis var. nudiflora]|uniref:Uncharacterized protein n=1 Tax=Prunus yedoensis var. nudiflora TaxID=2094558 RepID=A0A314XJ36_PRUYE|nr:hypothetical protein Pyn_19444 [Prunus yedoensis var. nudiflora]
MARFYAPRFFAPPPQLALWRLRPQLKSRSLLRPKEGPPPWVQPRPAYSVEKARPRPSSPY